MPQLECCTFIINWFTNYTVSWALSVTNNPSQPQVGPYRFATCLCVPRGFQWSQRNAWWATRLTATLITVLISTLPRDAANLMTTPNHHKHHQETAAACMSIPWGSMNGVGWWVSFPKAGCLECFYQTIFCFGGILTQSSGQNLM